MNIAITNIVLNKKGDTAPDLTIVVPDGLREDLWREVAQMAVNRQFKRAVRDFTMTVEGA